MKDVVMAVEKFNANKTQLDGVYIESYNRRTAAVNSFAVWHERKRGELKIIQMFPWGFPTRTVVTFHC